MQVKVIIYVLFLLHVFSSYGQQNADSAFIQLRNKWLLRFDTTLALLQLDTLEGKIKARHSKNYKLRAETIQSLVENCAGYYEKRFPGVNFTVELLLLDKQDWNKVIFVIPYGMPASIIERNKLVLAADKKAVGKFFGQTDSLPDNVLSEFDYIALHELGHNFLLRVTKTDAKKEWANEFLASYFAISYLNENKINKGLPQIDQSDFQPKYKTLDDFEKFYFGMSPQNYAWYQGKFQKLGYQLYPKFNIGLLREFIKNYEMPGKKLDPISLLQQLAPDIMTKFLEEMK